MKKLISLQLSAATLALAISSTASAQPRPSPPSSADRRAVQRLVQQALRIARRPEGRETAADRFLQAFDRIPNCVFLANAASLLRQVEARHADAGRHARRVLSGECLRSDDGAERRIAESILAQLEPPPAVVTPPPVPTPPSNPPPVPVVEPVAVTLPSVEPPMPPIISPPVIPTRYRETRPVPATAIGFWVAGGMVLAGGALCLGWYVDAENQRASGQNVDTARWSQASNTALSVALPTLITGAALASVGFAFFALRPTRRVEILPAASSAFTGLQASLRF